jgi:septal ring factor EnvC (AmiA/AmiB activator)
VETAKTIALLVLGFLFIVLALHQPEIPKPTEHPVELSPAYIAVKNELAKTTEALTVAQRELKAQKAAAAEAAAEREREAKWAAATDAEARGALRTASKLYEEYAKAYPESKQAQLATRKAKKTLADSEAARGNAAAGAPSAPTTTPTPTP